MENNGMQAGMLTNLGSNSNLLGLERPLHPHHPQHHNPNSNLQQYPHHQQHQQMVTFSSHDTTSRLTQSPQRVKQTTTFSPYAATKGKQQQQQQQQQMGLSDDDEQGFGVEDVSGDGGKRGSPWQRVKWTDNMVRLLIMVVFYIGDDGCPEGNDAPGVMNKKKAGAMLQKKGKWKSVSKAMMEKGFYVSPQQCEDKFNDLNKRYKRVNDILGKGTACRVVENQSLLESMDQLSPKMKEEARKLLNSKHLFFREMCAYHNSGAHHSPESAVDLTNNPQQYQQQQHQQQQRCFHSQDGVQTSNSRNKMVRGGMQEDHDEDEDNEEDEEDADEDIDSEDEEEMQDVGGSGKSFNEHSGGNENGEITDKFLSRKKQRSMLSSSASTTPSMQQLSSELASIIQDVTKSPWEQRQWMRSRSLQLEEQQVTYQCQAFELEKQRMKWAKFSWKKEREMERMKLNNDRTRLENERMVLILHQKELELLDLPRQQGMSIKLPDLSG